MRTEVVGSGGVRIGVRVDGAETGKPIVFVHGWASSSRAWDEQFADAELRDRFRLVAMDLRGHGASDVPDGGSGDFDDPRAWADDLAAVLGLAGKPAVVVGWSYGGLVIADYLRVYGTRDLAGVVLVGAITEIGQGHPGGQTGPAMRDNLAEVLADDLEIALPALSRLCAGMANGPLPGPLAQALLGTTLTVPPHVRAGLFRRKIASGDALASVDVPALVMHGDADAVVDITAGEYAAGKIPGTDTRWWPGVGHLPFVESAREFNATLASFVEERARGAGTER